MTKAWTSAVREGYEEPGSQESVGCSLRFKPFLEWKQQHLVQITALMR